jgi:hypothetical protein
MEASSEPWTAGQRRATLPTFLIIGAPKSGTTSLHYYLDQHPEIQMSANKEPHFFAGPENGLPYPGGRIGDLETYEQLFDPDASARGEASPSYTVYPRRQDVPERIAGLIPDARFIYLVRDPIARTLSHYQHRVSLAGEQRSLSEALGDLTDSSSIFTCPSLYASQLDRYLAHFEQDRILVVDQADLLAERSATLGEIFSFLSVDAGFDSSRFDNELNANSERRVYSAGYKRFAEGAKASALRWLPRGVRRSLRRTVERTFFPPVESPVLHDDLRSRLAELYAGEAERLRELTGKTFSTWSI